MDHSIGVFFHPRKLIFFSNYPAYGISYVLSFRVYSKLKFVLFSYMHTHVKQRADTANSSCRGRLFILCSPKGEGWKKWRENTECYNITLCVHIEIDIELSICLADKTAAT